MLKLKLTDLQTNCCLWSFWTYDVLFPWEKLDKVEELKDAVKY